MNLKEDVKFQSVALFSLICTSILDRNYMNDL